MSHGSSLWKINRSEWDIFSNYVKFVVGDGINISLWQNVGRELALNDTFPDLCLLTKYKDACFHCLESMLVTRRGQTI